MAVAGLGDPVVCRNSADQSRRFSIVEIEQSAEPRPASNVSSPKGRRRGSLEQLVATSSVAEPVRSTSTCPRAPCRHSDRMTVTVSPECHLDPFLLLAAGVLLVAIEGRQG